MPGMCVCELVCLFMCLCLRVYTLTVLCRTLGSMCQRMVVLGTCRDIDSVCVFVIVCTCMYMCVCVWRE